MGPLPNKPSGGVPEASRMLRFPGASRIASRISPGRWPPRGPDSPGPTGLSGRRGGLGTSFVLTAADFDTGGSQRTEFAHRRSSRCRQSLCARRVPAESGRVGGSRGFQEGQVLPPRRRHPAAYRALGACWAYSPLPEDEPGRRRHVRAPQVDRGQGLLVDSLKGDVSLCGLVDGEIILDHNTSGERQPLCS